MTTERSSSEFYGPGTPCSQCGQELAANAPEWAEYCSVHSAMREEPFELELRKLIEEWREKRHEQGNEDNSFSVGLWVGYDAAADQLEALLDE